MLRKEAVENSLRRNAAHPNLRGSMEEVCGKIEHRPPEVGRQPAPSVSVDQRCRHVGPGLRRARIIPLLVVGLPILDTTLVTVLRIKAGRPVYIGGKDHCSHRLVALGFSQRGAVLMHYGLAALFGSLGLIVSLDVPSAPFLRPFALLIALLVAAPVFWRLGKVPVYEEAVAGGPSAEGSRVISPEAMTQSEPLSAA